MTTTTTTTITISTRVESPRPTSTSVSRGVDFDGVLSVVDETGERYSWRGTLTYAPDGLGRLAPFGDGLDHWMSAGLAGAVAAPWIAAHDVVVRAIVDSLGGGAGAEDVVVDL